MNFFLFIAVSILHFADMISKAWKAFYAFEYGVRYLEVCSVSYSSSVIYENMNIEKMNWNVEDEEPLRAGEHTYTICCRYETERK